MEKLKQNPIVKKLGLNRIMLVCILVLMFVVFKVVLGSKFPVGDSIKSTYVLLCTGFRLLHDFLWSSLCSCHGSVCAHWSCIWYI